MYTLEIAMFYNRRFCSWQDVGSFPSRAEAVAAANARGLKAEGDDFLVSLDGYAESDLAFIHA